MTNEIREIVTMYTGSTYNIFSYEFNYFSTLYIFQWILHRVLFTESLYLVVNSIILFLLLIMLMMAFVKPRYSVKQILLKNY
jgi:hypothetical protein